MLIYVVWIVLAARLAGERRDAVGGESDSGAAASAATALMMTATATVYWLWSLGSGRPVLPSQIPAEAWFGLFGVGVVSTFIAIQAFYAGAQRIGAAQASIISTVEPIWTIVLAYLLFGFMLTPVQLVGGALIIAGVLLAQTGPAAGRAPRSRDAPRGRVGRAGATDTPAQPPRAASTMPRAPADTNPRSEPSPMNRNPSSRWRGEHRAVVEQDAGRLAVALARGEDRPDGVEVDRVVEAARDAERVRQVGRSHEQDVGAGQRGDRVRVGDGRRVLDLERHRRRRR